MCRWFRSSASASQPGRDKSHLRGHARLSGVLQVLPLVRFGSNHVESDFDVAPGSVGICTRSAVRGACNGLGDFALYARQTDVKPCSKEVSVARIAQIYLGID